MQTFRKIVQRINEKFRRKQETSMKDEWSLLTEMWSEQQQDKWQNFKQQNAEVNAYFSRRSLAA